MKGNHLISAIIILVYTCIISCDSKPKVIDDQPIQNLKPNVGSTLPSAIPKTSPNENPDGHLVVVNEILNSEKYSYLNVTEDADEYWLAIPKKEVQIGGTYFYKGGLLKKNFVSKEYNRLFETIYLVSDVIPHPGNSKGSGINKTNAGFKSSSDTVNIPHVEGSTSLSELLSNPEKYDGKLVRVTGKFVKVNPMIMGRNWIHIQDGSSKDLDLTITTFRKVKVNDVATFEGTIALNSDFGAGYRYDVIMENAIVK